MMYEVEEKDRMRLRDIVKKSKGSKEKIISLSTTMAGRITDHRKAIARAIAADELARKTIADLEFDVFNGLVESAKIFLDRALNLPGVNANNIVRNLKTLGITFVFDEDSKPNISANDLII